LKGLVCRYYPQATITSKPSELQVAKNGK